MIVFLDGQFVPEHEANVSVFDRSFMYGDGLFETLRLVRGQPFRWGEHMARLEDGARELGISLPYPVGRLRRTARELSEINEMPDAILRVHVSRGTGRRGYSPRGANHPRVVLSIHPGPDPAAAGAAADPGWNVITAGTRVYSADRLARIKSASRLWSVAARMEADRLGVDEALVLNENGRVVEATGANVFWLENGVVFTPPLSAGALPGITRAVVIERCAAVSAPVREEMASVERLHQSQGVFLTLTSFGIVTIRRLDRVEYPPAERITRIRESYGQLVGWESTE